MKILFLIILLITSCAETKNSEKVSTKKFKKVQKLNAAFDHMLMEQNAKIGVYQDFLKMRNTFLLYTENLRFRELADKLKINSLTADEKLEYNRLLESNFNRVVSLSLRDFVNKYKDDINIDVIENKQHPDCEYTLSFLYQVFKEYGINSNSSNAYNNIFKFISRWTGDEMPIMLRFSEVSSFVPVYSTTKKQDLELLLLMNIYPSFNYIETPKAKK